MAISPITPKDRRPSPGKAHSLRGLGFMALGMFLYAGVDATGKFLADTINPVQVAWFRQCGLFAGVLVLISLRGRTVLCTLSPMLQIGRGALAAISPACFILGVSFVPLAEAIAITFVAPFLVTVMGAVLLKEPVGARRWAAVIVGFVGMLIVVRPGLGGVHPAAIFIFIAAASFAMRQILSRFLAGGDRTETTIAYTAITSWLLLCLPLPFIWQTPATMFEMLLLAVMAAFAAVAEVFVIMALTDTQAVVVAPMQYSMLLWATFYGFVIFGQLPDVATWIGAATIVVAGLFSLTQERRFEARTTRDDI